MPVALLSDVIPLRLRAGRAPALGGEGRAAAGAAGGCREAPSASARAAPCFAPGAESGAPGRPGSVTASGRLWARGRRRSEDWLRGRRCSPACLGGYGRARGGPARANGARPIGARSFGGAANGEHALRGRTWSAPSHLAGLPSSLFGHSVSSGKSVSDFDGSQERPARRTLRYRIPFPPQHLDAAQFLPHLRKDVWIEFRDCE